MSSGDLILQVARQFEDEAAAATAELARGSVSDYTTYREKVAAIKTYKRCAEQVLEMHAKIFRHDSDED